MFDHAVDKQDKDDNDHHVCDQNLRDLLQRAVKLGHLFAGIHGGRDVAKVGIAAGFDDDAKAGAGSYGTAGKTDLLVTWLYKLTIDKKNYNYGAVISILVFIISAAFSLIALNKSKVLDNEEAFQ